ncbi:hypothetical protein Taro_032033 [Colocasia esculenta]|uniref:Uncharacterized protein n=1 Tax=Colocasia esculenta TaxID=4460 RepID=A0A843VQD4_COLES|nr:hypothetical protein [Colocasia esculenta]
MCTRSSVDLALQRVGRASLSGRQKKIRAMRKRGFWVSMEWTSGGVRGTDVRGVCGTDNWGVRGTDRCANLRLDKVSSRKHIHISTKSTIPETCLMGGENMDI